MSSVFANCRSPKNGSFVQELPTRSLRPFKAVYDTAYSLPELSRSRSRIVSLPSLRRFAVSSNPPLMRELSFYKDVDPPHLNGYFISRKGQFKLEPLPGGRTRLDGTTWYAHRMWPAGYWQLWSDWIIHKIHRQVLGHIKGACRGEENKQGCVAWLTAVRDPEKP